MLSNYQIKISDFYIISIDNFKNLMPNFFDKKGMCSIMKTLLEARIKTKKIDYVYIRTQSVTIAKTICQI